MAVSLPLQRIQCPPARVALQHSHRHHLICLPVQLHLRHLQQEEEGWEVGSLYLGGGGTSIYFVTPVCSMTGLVREEKFPKQGSTFARLSLKQVLLVEIPP